MLVIFPRCCSIRTSNGCSNSSFMFSADLHAIGMEHANCNGKVESRGSSPFCEIMLALAANEVNWHPNF